MTKTVDGRVSPVLRESRRYKRHTKGTYIAIVANVIQDSPSKMLTFKQIMKKLAVFITGDRKGLENNIRVCLSSNKCFVKVPIDPEYPNAKRNFWRVDEGSITPKMLRRHFSDMTDLFPGLQKTRDRKAARAPDPSPQACPPRTEYRPIKFTGPFSIESLLQQDRQQQQQPQVRPNVQPAAQMGPSTSFSFSDQFYGQSAATDSLIYLDRMNIQPNMCYMYRSVQEASWRKPVESVDGFSPELQHALLYSPHFPYLHTLVTKVPSSPPNTDELRYRRWSELLG